MRDVPAAVLAFMAMAQPQAQVCGTPSGSPPTVTCATTGNPYADGIAYDAPGGLTLTAADGVQIVRPTTGPGLTGLSVNGTGTVAIKASNILVDLTADDTQSVRYSIIGQGAGANIVIDVSGTIRAKGLSALDDPVAGIAGEAHGIAATGASATITYRGPLIEVQGSNSFGIMANLFGGGNVSVDASGNINSVSLPTGEGNGGIFAWTSGGPGDASVHYRSGTMNVSGPIAHAIQATSYDSGSASVITDPGTTIIVNGDTSVGQRGNAGYAIFARSQGGTAASGATVTVDSASTIQATGLATASAPLRLNPIGIVAYAGVDAPITVTYRGPGITTVGASGMGILAQSAQGNVTVNASGPISTDGLQAAGIYADSGVLARLGAVQRTSLHDDSFSEGPAQAATGIGGTIAVTATSAIATKGIDSPGIRASSATGAVTVNASQVAATGQYSSGIDATSASTVDVNIAAAGSVNGGWQADPAQAGPGFGRPAAGVSIGSTGAAAATLGNGGMVGALSDLAINGIGGSGSTLAVTNLPGGVINGYATLGAGTLNSIDNQGTWNLRHFADTNGDGARDALRVAVLDMGSAGTGHFNNGGTLALPAVASAATVDTAGQYLPFGDTRRAMAPGGPMQGQIRGVGPASFVNSGVIDLQANPVAGDVLLITGASTPGTAGRSNYVSNGGTLKVDVVLNEGGAAARSDMLVVDGTQVGAGGATKVQVRNAGGAGALTSGDGVGVVEVLDKSRSAAGAFSLAGRVVAGPYEYLLLQGGKQAPADGNWYLRSVQVEPSPPLPPNPDPPTPRPLFRPEVGAYLSNQRQAAGMFAHSLHDRLGEPQWIETQAFDTPDDKRRSGWLRIVGKNGGTTSRDGTFDVDTDSTLIQGGGDLASWGVGGERSRLHLGGMLGYGSADSDATAAGNPARASGKVEGWSMGLYGTWYQNNDSKLGWYADVWGTYGWFSNKVQGDTLPEVKYDAKAYTLSGETGYAMRIASTDWIVEPQAQLLYIRYDEDDITEPNGTRINGNDGSGWTSRLGVRSYRTFVNGDGRRLQPYLTVNWWHDSIDNSLAFNQVTLKDLYPGDRYEVKLGLNADLARGWTAWGALGYQWGSQDFRNTTARLGAKYTW